MAKYRLLTMNSPVEGREEEFNTWYSETHLKDVLKVPGFKTAQRFKVHEPALLPDQPPHRYLAVYDLETDDLAETLKELRSRPGTDLMTMSDALNRESPTLTIYEVITPMLVAD